MPHLKFDMSKLEKLNDPGRLESLPPDVFWRAVGEPTDAQVIVEIGAGTGLFAAEFAARAPEAIVYAADTAEQMLDWMRRHRPEVARGRVVPVAAEETHVPLGDGIADVVYTINLHHELADPEATYSEAYRLLKPGGRVLVVDWADRDTPKGPPRDVRVSSDALAGFLTRAGFGGVTVDSATLAWHLMAAGRRPPG